MIKLKIPAFTVGVFQSGCLAYFFPVTNSAIGFFVDADTENKSVDQLTLGTVSIKRRKITKIGEISNKFSIGTSSPD